MKVSRQRLALTAGVLAFVAVVLVQGWKGNPLTFDTILNSVIAGVTVGSIYAVAASGLVVTYTTSGIFNFAQGAIGMFMAFLYWELRFHRHYPAPVALFLVILVAAPLLGAVIERVLMRRIADSALVVQLVITIGLMLAFMGLAVTIWDPTESRSISFFFGTEGFTIGETKVLWHRFITICVAVVIAIFLRLLLYRTRIGVTMRAVVDNRSLAGLHGARPNQASMLSWALGCSMAAVAGILVAPELGLQVDALTLIIINAFAAAIVGQLRSLPLTYMGAILLGLVLTFSVNFLDLSGRYSTAQFAIPTIFLFIALLAVPQARLELRKLAPSSKILQPRVSKVGETALGMAFLFTLVWFFTRDMGQVNLNRMTLAIVTATIMLSFIPLTGWAGQVSLAQLTFAGVGAFAMFKFAGDSGSPFGLLWAALLAIPFGAAMALPALRLQGLYLALASMAFARMAEPLFFDQPEVFGRSGNRIARLSIFGYEFTDQRAYLLLVTGLFGAMAVFVVGLRRSRYGRRLVALRDSEAACATLGVNRLTTKLSVYGLSAAMAGFGGALLGMQRGTAGTADFTMLQGLPILLLAVAGGVATVTGSLFGGFATILFIILKDTFDWSWLQAAERVGPALLVMGIVINPNGASVGLGFLVAPLLPWRKDARQAWRDEMAQRKKARQARAAVRAAARAPEVAPPASTPPAAGNGEGVKVPADREP